MAKQSVVDMLKKPMVRHEPKAREGTVDLEERTAAHYRSDLAAEVKLREAAEKLAQEADSRAIQAEQERKTIADKLESTAELLNHERQSRETSERRGQERTKEIESLQGNLARLQALSKSVETMLPIVQSLPSTLDNRDIQPALDKMMAQLQELKKVPRETLSLPVKEPMPSFDFKPTYGQDGQIVGIRATPLIGRG